MIKSKLQSAQENAEKAIKKTNAKINELGEYTTDLYEALNLMQGQMDKIRGIPHKDKKQYEEFKKVRLSWRQQAEKIRKEYKTASAESVGNGAAGVGIGVAMAALGPSAAMGIATTFGVASTGTAISALSGAAATNAALAWLGGGAIAAGGGGIAAGNALLALAGPAGWAIAGVAALSSIILFFKARYDRDCLGDIYTLIAKRDIKSYELAIVELNERILRIKDETKKLKIASEQIKAFGINYKKMTKEQQYTLGSYLNLMKASTQLLVNPILGLQAKYSENDYDEFIKKNKSDKKYKSAIIYMANLLYNIKLDEKDKKMLWNSFRENEEMLKSIGLKKEEFGYSLIETVCEALRAKG